MLPSASANLRKPLAGFGVGALQRGVELGMRDRSNEAQPLGAAAGPAAGRFSVAAIVIIPLQMVVIAQGRGGTSSGGDRGHHGSVQGPLPADQLGQVLGQAR